MPNAAPSEPRRPDRLFLVLLGMGLMAMLAVSVAYRLAGPPLVQPGVRPPAAAPVSDANRAQTLPGAAFSSPDMPADRPPAMADALERQGMQGPTDAAPSADRIVPAMGSLAGDDTRRAAMIALMQRLQADPHDVDTLLELAEQFRTDTPERAHDFLNRAMVAAPADPRPPYYLGVLLSDLGRYDEAAEAMSRSLSLGDSPATRYSLAVILRYHLNRAAEADEHLRAALDSPALTLELRTLVETELGR